MTGHIIKVQRRKHPDPASYPRKRRSSPNDWIAVTNTSAQTPAKKRVLAMCKALIDARPERRIPKRELLLALKNADKRVAGYSGYICWLLEQGCLVAVEPPASADVEQA